MTDSEFFRRDFIEIAVYKLNHLLKGTNLSLSTLCKMTAADRSAPRPLVVRKDHHSSVYAMSIICIWIPFSGIASENDNGHKVVNLIRLLPVCLTVTKRKVTHQQHMTYTPHTDDTDEVVRLDQKLLIRDKSEVLALSCAHIE